MKHSFLRFALLGLLATGCAKKSDPTPPAPEVIPQDVITLQITGTNLLGRMPVLGVNTAAGDDGGPLYVQNDLTWSESYSGASINRLATVATVPHYRAGRKRYDFIATIQFGQNSTTGVNSQFSVQWLVNGKPVSGTSRPSAVSISGTTYAIERAYLATDLL